LGEISFLFFPPLENQTIDNRQKSFQIIGYQYQLRNLVSVCLY